MAYFSYITVGNTAIEGRVSSSERKRKEKHKRDTFTFTATDRFFAYSTKTAPCHPQGTEIPKGFRIIPSPNQ